METIPAPVDIENIHKQVFFLPQGDAEFLPIHSSSGCWTRLFKLYIIGLPPPPSDSHK